MDEEKVCAICEEPIEEDEEFFTLEDGSVVCESCYENSTEECAMCGGRFHEDDMTFWGDVRICPGCLDAQCPSFDEDKNQSETQEAYDAFCAKYIGKRVVDQEAGTLDFDIEVGDEAPISYSISVTIDEKGIITDISRLTASMMLSESLQNSDWRPYPINCSDYDFWAEDLLEDNLEFADEEDDEEDEDEESDE